MPFLQHIYALADPLQPELVRYVGRTNNLDLRFRMHLSEAESGFTIKDVWLMYLRYEGREPIISVLEQSEFSDSAVAEKWAKTQEKVWIKEMAAKEPSLLNGSRWASHPDRKAIPKGVKTAWCETHVLLWAIDRSWQDEHKLLTHLNDRFGSITRESRQPNGSTICESMAELSLAQSQYEGKRFRVCSILRALSQAHTQLEVGSLETLVEYECPVT
ncbi:GIY-YIG nuclease family protein [Planctomycetes bacterium K23_9]|uniref:GIY-YIG domain-containing protein n=1 Tax=Stieleria marina TaxID=1930275 RepID=A0A517P200_9BACT|nr:hypothetical protein K239x_54250 [Planctomycetes bacterium K23_9]